MGHARGSVAHEGVQSTDVTDALKLVCPSCNGTRIQVRAAFMDANSATEGCAVFKALLLTATGGDFCCQIASCHCGHIWVPYWFIIDIAVSNGTTLTMTNLDQGTTANLMAGLYMIFVGDDANDTLEYFVIASNTAAAPTVITTVVAPHGDSDGAYVITNLLPTGMTAAA